MRGILIVGIIILIFVLDLDGFDKGKLIMGFQDTVGYLQYDFVLITDQQQMKPEGKKTF
jgi:hypothetical protein